MPRADFRKHLGGCAAPPPGWRVDNWRLPSLTPRPKPCSERDRAARQSLQHGQPARDCQAKAREKRLSDLSHHFCAGKPDPETQYHEPPSLSSLSPTNTDEAPPAWGAEEGHRRAGDCLERARVPRQRGRAGRGQSRARICWSRGAGQNLREEHGQKEFHTHPQACPSSPLEYPVPPSTAHLPMKAQFPFLIRQLVGVGVLVW